MTRRILAVCALAVAWSAAESQPIAPAPQLSAVRAAPSTTSRVDSVGQMPLRPPADPPAAWYAPLASAVLPGSGQALLRQNRALAYLAVELYAYIGYRSQTIQAKRERNRYHTIARDIARAFSPGADIIGPFEYYESMEKYVESGAFDRIPGGDVDPEIDLTTFNGAMWKLARDTYWADPDEPPAQDSPAYINAINLYLQRAVGPDLQWSWRNAALEHDLYRRSIGLSNDAFRRAHEQLGVLVANHLLSLADAFATVRVRTTPAGNESAWTISVTMPLPRGP